MNNKTKRIKLTRSHLTVRNNDFDIAASLIHEYSLISVLLALKIPRRPALVKDANTVLLVPRNCALPFFKKHETISVLQGVKSFSASRM